MPALATPCCNTAWRALIGTNDESANMITAKCKVHPTYVCKSMASIWSGLFLLLPVFLGRVQPETAVLKLGRYNVDKDQISVSGLSSGAYFAVQFHVSFSKTIMGAGVVAGGPFWCANDDVEIALNACMKKPSDIDVSELVSITYRTAITKTIDPPNNLKTDRVYLFSGTKDTVVEAGVMKKAEEYYKEFVKSESVVTEFNIPAEHSMVTDDYGNACGVLGSPFINNCNYSTATYMLQHIYPDVKSAPSSYLKPQNLMEYDQTEFFLDLPSAVSMDTTGYMYVPTACKDGAKQCRLHVAFHGCLQGRKFVSNTFALHAGYNSLAELNDIIVLYPQAKNSTLNPRGCWDWWGYTGPQYGCKLGAQMAGVKLMLDRVADLL